MHANTYTKPTAPLKERRKDYTQREIVEHGVSLAHEHLMPAVEYLLARNVETQVIKRVVLGTLSARLSSEAAAEHC